MNLNLFKRNFKGTLAENKFLRNALIASIVVNGLVGIGAVSRDPIVTIIPPGMAEQSWLDSKSAGEEYTEAWALYIADRLGNVTPSTSEIIIKTLEPLLSPDIYQDVVNALNEQVAQIRRDRVTLKFEPKEVVREKNNLNKFFVVGRSMMEGPNGHPERETRTYEIEIGIHNYKPIVKNINTYTGKPRTEDVLKREARSTEAKARLEKNSNEN